jgi:hypothetical protein
VIAEGPVCPRSKAVGKSQADFTPEILLLLGTGHRAEFPNELPAGSFLSQQSRYRSLEKHADLTAG